MSRIGKKSITIPKDISIVVEKQKIIVKGKNGNLEQEFLDIIDINVTDNQIFLTRKNDTKKSKSYHGLMRALIQNMVTGISEKFTRILIAEGIGYKFVVEKSKVIANVGFTHPVEFQIPDDISIKLESATKILITGINKEKVGLLASQIRAVRPPEPYKGKGIMYEGEKILRKAGKTGK